MRPTPRLVVNKGGAGWTAVRFCFPLSCYASSLPRGLSESPESESRVELPKSELYVTRSSIKAQDDVKPIVIPFRWDRRRVAL